MLVAHISDTHISNPAKGGAYSFDKISALENCVDDINELDSKPDIVIHTGDVSHNCSVVELEIARGILSQLSVPYFVTPGNKDVGENFFSVFGHKFGKLTVGDPIIYLVDLFETKFVSLDTTLQGDNLGFLGHKKLAALDAILMEQKCSPTILFAHHPPFSSHKMSPADVSYRDDYSVSLFSEIVDRHPQIVGMLCGHLHRPLRQNFGFFDVSVVPPICSKIWRREDEKPQGQKAYYHLHTFDGFAEYTTEKRAVFVG